MNDSSLQALQVVKTLARMLEQVEKFLVEQVLFEKNYEGEGGDAGHGHGETNLPQLRLIMAQEQGPVSHERKRKQGNFREHGSDLAAGTFEGGQHLGIAKAAPSIDCGPEKSQGRGYERKIVETA